MHCCSIYLYFCCLHVEFSLLKLGWGELFMNAKAFDLGNDYRIEKLYNPQLDVDLDLYFSGLENCLSDFACGPFIRDCFLIHYITRGKGFYIYNDERYELSEGDLFCIFPGIFTYYATYSDDPWSFCWVGFNGRKSLEMLKIGGITTNSPVMHLLPEFALDELIKSCVYTVGLDESYSKTMFQGFLYLIMSKIHDNFRKSGICINIKNTALIYVEKAFFFIDYNYYKSISVHDIYTYIGLERTYFSKIFKQVTGKSPQNYLIHYRIEKAVELMKMDQFTFKQIALSVGISNEYYFSRLFKKVKGVSPREFLVVNNIHRTIIE